jgi:hypothetical protein
MRESSHVRWGGRGKARNVARRFPASLSHTHTPSPSHTHTHSLSLARALPPLQVHDIPEDADDEVLELAAPHSKVSGAAPGSKGASFDIEGGHLAPADSVPLSTGAKKVWEGIA